MKKVLITGMSGLIGGILRRHLEELGGYELSALNRRPVEGVKTIQADIADLDAIKPAFEGIDVVVHLAAHVQNEPFEDIVNASIVGLYNVFEAVRLAGVKRVVYASSGASVRGWERVPPYDAMVEGRYEDAPESLLMFSDSVLPNWPAKMSGYGDINVDSEGAGKATGSQQLTGRAHDSGSGGHVDGSERTPRQAHPGGLQRGGSSRTRSW